MKKLLIVCEEKLRKYGDFLAQLVSLEDDEDGNIRGTRDGAGGMIVWPNPLRMPYPSVVPPSFGWAAPPQATMSLSASNISPLEANTRKTGSSLRMDSALQFSRTETSFSVRAFCRTDSTETD